MKQSFLQARPKKILSVELKWLLVSFGVVLVVMIAATILVNRSINEYKVEIAAVERSLANTDEKYKDVDAEVIRLEALLKLAEESAIKNRMKKENVQNFFDIVPDDVVLEVASLKEGTLYLRGVTQSKKKFSVGFERALKSMFGSSTTRFVRLKNGTYRFRNISKIEGQ